MKRILCVLMVSFVLFSGCFNEGNVSIDSDVEKYLKDHHEFIEPVCAEWENGEILIENNTLYSLKNNKQEQILDEISISTWAPFSDHSIIVIYGDYNIVEVNLKDLTQNIIYEASDKIISMNTDGVLIFFANIENEVYRYFVPSGEIELLATDEMFISLLCPISTTDICWLSYNPAWLKAYYKIGSEDNIYNISSTFYAFCDTATKKTYFWEPETALDGYDVQGLKWYLENK